MLLGVVVNLALRDTDDTDVAIGGKGVGTAARDVVSAKVPG